MVAAAQVIKEPVDPLDALGYVDERLSPQPVMEPLEDAESELEPGVRNGWHEFRGNRSWKGQVDRRSGRVDFAEGDGIPWVPGRGNSLKSEDIANHLNGKKKPDLSTLESISRSFLPKVAHLLGVDVKSLKLAAGRSGSPSDYLWYLDYDVEIDGLAVEGARVVFRLNHGNLIQFGSENLPSPNARAPKAQLTREQALAVLADYAGGMRAGDVFLDNGSQLLVPVAVEDSRFNEKFEFGKGRGLARVW
jgi:hypothetical protein